MVVSDIVHKYLGSRTGMKKEEDGMLSDSIKKRALYYGIERGGAC